VSVVFHLPVTVFTFCVIRQAVQDLTECVRVVAGELIAEVAGVDYTVVGGEGVSFDGRLAHRYRNESDKQTEIILSVTPPNP
jgi:uncharacterized cupin superfamily protein